MKAFLLRVTLNNGPASEGETVLIEERHAANEVEAIAALQKIHTDGRIELIRELASNGDAQPELST